MQPELPYLKLNKAAEPTATFQRLGKRERAQLGLRTMQLGARTAAAQLRVARSTAASAAHYVAGGMPKGQKRGERGFDDALRLELYLSVSDGGQDKSGAQLQQELTEFLQQHPEYGTAVPSVKTIRRWRADMFTAYSIKVSS